jgi:hypothetical protein
MEEDNESTKESLDKRFIAPMADSIRKAYIEQKSHMLGGAAGKIGKRHDKAGHWRRAAEQCLRLKADPESYVRACFLFCNMSTGPFANMLGGSAAKMWYEKFQHLISKDGKTKKQDGENVSQAVDREGLAWQITAAREAMVRLSGSCAPIPINIDWVCRWSTQVEPHVKILLAYPDDRARERFGKDAYAILISSPNVVAAAEKLGYPIEDILVWLQIQN